MDFQEMANHRTVNNPHGQHLGVTVEEIRTGYGRAVKTVSPDDRNPQGGTHGGIYFSLADIACSAAIASHGRPFVTLNSNISFLRGTKVGDTLIAEAQETKGGKSIRVYDVQITDQNGTLVCSATFTFFHLD